LTLKRILTIFAVAALASCAPAAASVPHTVQPGETLWSIAARNNFSTRALAAANGLSENSNVVLGSTIQIPSAPEAAAALQRTGVVPPTTSATTGSRPQPGAPGHPLGSYVVRPGDSLTSIAARSGVSMGQVAFMNGLDPSRPLLIGTVLKLPTGSRVAPSTPPPAQRVVPNAAPYPTPERVSAPEIEQIAAAHGVPASLAAAVGWQESGFNNDLVSSANARGVMQILPGTWSWINSNLTLAPLNAASATDNVHAGVIYLGRLLKDTGGDIPTAVASYYQGLESVRRIGMLPETRQYVNSVLSLRSRFGGP
jgi:LysM repeat protein